MNFFDDISQYANSIAFISEKSEQITYNTFIQMADKITNNIDGRCLVFCVCQNCLESVAGYIGFLRGRIVPIMVSESLKPELLNKLLERYKPKYIWLPQKNIEYIRSMKEIYSFNHYALLKTPYTIDYTLNDELALLLTTSGSTGSPKLVKQSYKNITSNANAIAQYLNISKEDRPITTMPMSYTYGLSIINSNLLKGASLILTSKTLMEKEFWVLLKENRATTFGGVPYIYEMLKKLRFERMNLPSLTMLTQAGGKLSLEVSQEFSKVCQRKGISFITMYGQAEATARMAYLSKEFAIEKAGSIGMAIPGGAFWLEDNKGNIITDSEVVGELAYQGDNVSMGYAENSYDLEKGDENKGILRTGDLAKRDCDGFYYIVGRKNRFIKLFGSRVNLDEVENLLISNGYECACAGEDDQLKVYTTWKEDHEVIRKFIIDYSDINPSGFKIIHIDSIPHSDNGKILYSALN